MDKKIWPTGHGDHRAAMRGDGDGAALGRVRWQRDLGGAGGGGLIDERGRIFVNVGETIRVLTSDGGDVAAFSPESGLGLRALHGDVVLLSDEQRLVACDLRGDVRWSFAAKTREKLAAHALGPGGELVVWTMPEQAWRSRSDLRWLDERGVEVRREPFPCTFSGLVLDSDLVFDDAGVLYALLVSRIGDGVSGGDRADGATAAFAASGCLWSHPVRTDDWLHTLYGAASGVLLVGDHVAHVDRSGETLWRVKRDELERFALAGTDMDILTTGQLAELPEILRAYTFGGGQYHARSFDRAGNSYFTGPLGDQKYNDDDRQVFVSFDREHRVRWTLPSPGFEWGDTPPAIGPDTTVLVRVGSLLLAIE